MMDQERLLSLEGLTLGEIATVQPCGHVLPLTVAVRAATATAAATASVGPGTTNSASTSSSKRGGGEGGAATQQQPELRSRQHSLLRLPGCPRCRLLLLEEEDVHPRGHKHTSRGRSRSGGGGRPVSSSTTTIIQAVVDGWAMSQQGRPHDVVTFKYKNCLYSLGIAAEKEDTEKEAFDQQRLSAAAAAAAAASSSSLLSTMTTPRGATQPAATTTLAQDRIRTVLGLTSLKVLCRGKVVYPNPALSEQEISNLLLKESASAQVQSHHKVSLLVMGTMAGHELAARELPTSSSSGNRNKDDIDDHGSSTSSSWWWWKAAIAWGGYVAQLSVSLAKTLLLGTLSALQVACNAAHHLFLTTIVASNTTTNNATSSIGHGCRCRGQRCGPIQYDQESWWWGGERHRND